MSKPKLYYFDIRGIGETARLLLHYGKIEFEDCRFTGEEWASTNLRAVSQTKKLPVLQIEGHYLIESYAINRFLAKRVGLEGKGEFEQAHVDAVADIVKDFYAAVAPWLYRLKGWIEGDASPFKAKHFDESVKIYLPLFVQILEQSGSNFVAKSGLTWADFPLTEFLLSLKQVEPTVLNGYPVLQDYMARIRLVPELKDYYLSRNEQ